MQFSDGIYYDVSIDDYHSSDGYSRSNLLDLTKSYRHFQYSLTKERKEPSDAMQIGSAVHLMLLEPKLVESEVVLMPEFNRRTKEGREQSAAFKEANQGKVILDADGYEQAKIMSERLFLRIESELEGYLASSVNEASVYFTIDDIQYKCRPDAFVKGIVLDVKTTKDASKRNFTRDAIDKGYLVQAAMIKHGLSAIGQELISYCLACVENAEPYATALYMLDEDAMEFGAKQFLSLHEKLKRLLDTKPEFVDYETDYLTLPAWANYVEIE